MYLFLNDIGGGEVLLILVFILIFFGSKSIPEIARTVGRTFRQIQDASSEIQHEIKKTANNYTKELNLDGVLKETVKEVQRPLDQAVNDLDNSVEYAPPKRNEKPSETEKKVEPGTAILSKSDFSDEKNEANEA